MLPFRVYRVFFCLNLNEALLLLSPGRSVILPLLPKAGSSPQFVTNFLMSLNEHHYIKLNYT